MNSDQSQTRAAATGPRKIGDPTQIKRVEEVITQWMASLDAGDLEGMIETCHSEAVTVNEGQPTTVGTEAIREKYGPRIDSFEIRSTFAVEHIAVYPSFAVVVGSFGGEMTDKATGEARSSSGRLTLCYQRDQNSDWKMILDVDNNAERS